MSRRARWIQEVMARYPVTRGMLTYSLLFPASNCTQQLLDSNRDRFNLWEVLRFCLFGTFVLAPSLYCWVRLANVLVKMDSLKGAVVKACIEQFTWAPVAYMQFYVCINLMEGKTWEQCKLQCHTKIPETWKVGVCVWPLVQTVNFWIVPMRHRVSFVAFFSYLWNTFLSYMHHKNPAVEAAHQ